MAMQIKLRRRLAATPDEVYEAWTDARSLSQWLLPIVGGHTQAVVDARVGQRYRIEMFGVSSRHEQQGEYLRLERPRLIEFTWIADPAAAQRSIVTVELEPAGDAETELTLTHRLLPNEASAQSHQSGWDAGLDSLLAYVNRADQRHYRREIHLQAPASAVYAALSTQRGLRSWWTQDCTSGEEAGQQARFTFGKNHKLVRIDTLKPDRQVRWHCLESHIETAGHTFPDNEWAGTSIVFRLNGDTATHTVLRVEHLGLTPRLACHALCEQGWDHYLASLRRYVEQGAGDPHLAGTVNCATSPAAAMAGQ